MTLQAPLILKLGGSLVETGRIGPILDIVARAKHPIAVVPGGGPFADAVRGAQKEIGYSDAAAHRMAILAMHQMAILFLALQPKLVPAETLADFTQAWEQERVPVWLPLRLSENDQDVPADWSITSDGLAARLAERLGGRSVVLVKSCRVAPGVTPAELARDGVVDPAFADIVTRAGLDWLILGPGEEVELARLIGVAPKKAELSSS